MSLYKLTGVEDYETIGRRSKAERKSRRKERKAERKETRAEKKAERKANGGGIRKILKVGASPSRVAFLILVDLNALKIATKLYEAWNKDPKKVTKMWEGAGGNINKLKKAISKGSKQTVNGVSGVTTATAIATATPIIVLVASMLKELKLTSKSEEGDLDKAIEQGTKDLEANPDIEKTYADMPSDNPVAVIPKGSPNATPTDETKDNTMLYIGLGAVALILGTGMLKKK